jgi:hypothetical protein
MMDRPQEAFAPCEQCGASEYVVRSKVFKQGFAGDLRGGKQPQEHAVTVSHLECANCGRAVYPKVFGKK